MCLAEGHNIDCAGGEHPFDSQSNAQVALYIFLSFFTGTVDCADVVPKIVFYNIT